MVNKVSGDYAEYISRLAEEVKNFELSPDITTKGFVKNSYKLFPEYKHLYKGDKYIGTLEHSQFMTLDLLINSKCAITLDWKWMRDDLLLPEIQCHIPSLYIEPIKVEVVNKEEKYIGDPEITYEFKLDDHIFKGKMKYGDLDNLLDEVNTTFLEKRYNRTIVSLDTAGDYYALLIVPTDKFIKLINSDKPSILYYVLHNVQNLHLSSFDVV